MKISKKSCTIAITFLCVGFASYPLIGVIKEKLNDDVIEISGVNASFFNEYIVPIAQHAGGSNLDYRLFYGYEDKKKIEISAKSMKLSYDDFYSLKNVIEVIDLTNEKLTEIYCKYSGLEPVSPNTPDAGFIMARRENKVIGITYYDRTGQTFLFGIGVGPSSCDK
ncbi:hypothetical protein ACMV5I_23080 [Serratia sp. T13T92]|uniref:hypothetical protein n=1 Tax=Serratia sp. T13T92 TaxID=3397496 RepID=UPI0039E0809E